MHSSNINLTALDLLQQQTDNLLIAFEKVFLISLLLIDHENPLPTSYCHYIYFLQFYRYQLLRRQVQLMINHLVLYIVVHMIAK
jgi:hypothetical protein